MKGKRTTEEIERTNRAMKIILIYLFLLFLGLIGGYFLLR